MSHPGTPELPSRIGRYEVRRELGRGSMGVVYQARDPQLDRLVAIKTLPGYAGVTPEQRAEFLERLRREATAAGRLSHPNVVAVHDLVDVGDVPHLVMEHVEGRTLAALFAAEAPLPPDRAVDLARQVCRALEHAHAQGIVHRDIKPSNIFLTPDGVAKLGDFGIARTGGLAGTRTGTMIGTPAFMAPEQVRGDGASPRSDLFALGAVLYEALTGRSPFRADEVATTLYRVVHVDPDPPRTLSPVVSPALDAVVRRALAKDPGARYPSACALAEALDRALQQPDQAADPVRARTARQPGWLPRGRVAIAVGAGVLGALGLAAVVSWGPPLRGAAATPAARAGSPAAAAPAESRAAAEPPRVPVEPERPAAPVASSSPVSPEREPSGPIPSRTEPAETRPVAPSLERHVETAVRDVQEALRDLVEAPRAKLEELGAALGRLGASRAGAPQPDPPARPGEGGSTSER